MISRINLTSISSVPTSRRLRQVDRLWFGTFNSARYLKWPHGGFCIEYLTRSPFCKDMPRVKFGVMAFWGHQIPLNTPAIIWEFVFYWNPLGPYFGTEQWKGQSSRTSLCTIEINSGDHQKAWCIIKACRGLKKGQSRSSDFSPGLTAISSSFVRCKWTRVQCGYNLH